MNSVDDDSDYQNSSFQNYSNSSSSSSSSLDRTPAKPKRKRGISAVLHDRTNLDQPLQKRSSKACAESAIHKMSFTTKLLPRGDPTAAVSAKQNTQTQSTPSETADVEAETDSCASLCSIFGKSRGAFDKSASMLLSYIHRNASYEIQKGLAVSLMATAMTKWGYSITDAAQIASEYTDISPGTIRKWASSFFIGLHNLVQTSPDNVNDECIEDELSSERGHSHSSPSSLIHDEQFQLEARTYIRQNAYVKGEPNLTVDKFMEWVASTYKTTIHKETARRWFHELGFSRVHHQKGVYFDGHDRSDVVAYRNSFLADMEALDKRSITFDGNIPELAGEKPLIRVVHDESTFHANCDQSYFWGDENTNVLRQKSLGAGIMVSDFVDEVSGFVRTETEEARFLLETSKDGYFNNDHLLDQVKHTIDIFEKIHPDATGLFLFDNAPSHKKLADDGLNVEKMNVNPGGKQPLMMDTTWNDEIQTMVYPDGVAKGMKAVLEERGVDTDGMKAAEMRTMLKTYEDFKNPKTLLENLVENRGHLCVFYPKYHCEMSPIELVWCHAKKYTRAYANGSIVRLRNLVPDGLNSVTTEQIKNFFRLCRDYERAYREGHTGKDVEETIKVYKSHRRVNA